MNRVRALEAVLASVRERFGVRADDLIAAMVLAMPDVPPAGSTAWNLVLEFAERAQLGPDDVDLEAKISRYFEQNPSPPRLAEELDARLATLRSDARGT